MILRGFQYFFWCMIVEFDIREQKPYCVVISFYFFKVLVLVRPEKLMRHTMLIDGTQEVALC